MAMNRAASSSRICYSNDNENEIPKLPKIITGGSSESSNIRLPAIRDLLREVEIPNDTSSPLSTEDVRLSFTKNQRYVNSLKGHFEGLLRLSGNHLQPVRNERALSSASATPSSVPPQFCFLKKFKCNRRLQKNEIKRSFDLKYIKKPNCHLLNAAKIVETSSKSQEKVLTGNKRADNIIRLNGDYQLEVARILEFNSTTFDLLEKWPLSQHSDDVKDRNNMSLLIDLIPSTSIAVTLAEAQKVCEGIKKIQRIKKNRMRALERANKSARELLHNTRKVQKPSKVHSPAVDFSYSPSNGPVETQNTSNKSLNDRCSVINHYGHYNEIHYLSADSAFGKSRECEHCLCSKTPEWRKGPRADRSLCNACGLFYKKLTRKFGVDSANIILQYRKSTGNLDRRVPKTYDVPANYRGDDSAFK
ncbi:LAFE_0C06788g1_1 [Lachancea fermentati]|uniref:LAFE_0C06788g1_1 n=1 Tax=Lachancea fermentati TaxID=4955 RepID=A0A1G4MA14_LACFM|nr:LAFE_0C06788g1_1 [Lachancea fermentati]